MRFYPAPAALPNVHRLYVGIFFADLVFGVAEFFVVRDQYARAAYAASLHTACPAPCGYTPSFGYGFLTQVLTMTGHGVSLSSPPTLAWVQVLAFVLVGVNAWFLYSLVRSRRLRRAAEAGGTLSTPP